MGGWVGGRRTVPWSIKTPEPMRAAGWESGWESGWVGGWAGGWVGEGRTVVDKDARTDASSGVDVYLKELVDLTLEEEGEGVPPCLPEPVSHTMSLQGLGEKVGGWVGGLVGR